ncbi:MAG: hypothetical protein ATN31_07935 [Candidatus Epulonipiscioides saccharophilum]|nr:MAG: hypothetical protein ATN31_07935 [Epulopiscium sp. AS2M-Bin001]
MQTKYKSQKSQLRPIDKVTFAALCIFFVVVVNYANNYFNPPLVGEWKSDQTNEIIYFNETGSVRVGSNNNYATYELLTPTKMSYIVDDKKFNMYYELDGRTLYWGPDKNSSEIFKR